MIRIAMLGVSSLVVLCALGCSGPSEEKVPAPVQAPTGGDAISPSSPGSGAAPSAATSSAPGAPPPPGN